MDLAQWKLNTKIGTLYLVASNLGLRSINRERQNCPLLKSLRGNSLATKFLRESAQQLEEYFQGRRRDFSLTLEPQGTAFQMRVWRELTHIPYGQTCSYQDISIRIGNKKAARAVGTANGRNPLCIVVPCHRVIATDGSLGGYSGGLTMKLKLLELENCKF